MFRLIETLKCKDGKLHNLQYHNYRLNKSRRELFRIYDEMKLENHISVPENAQTGNFKCRLIYSDKIEKTEFIPYLPRKIKSLKLVNNNEIVYTYKYENRNLLNQLFEARGDCDDILIIKNGRVTDSFYANVVFYDGQKWWTPDTPLLPGTQRARLIESNQIEETAITTADIFKYEKVGLINAMQNLDEMPVIPIQNIKSNN